MTLSHKQPGDRFRGISATAWNAFVDAANEFERFRAEPGAPEDPPRILIPVRNDSGTDAERHKCLALATAPIIVPERDEDKTYDTFEPFYAAEEAILPDHWNRWCVPIEPIADERPGMAVMRGIVPALVTMRHADHPRVEPDPDTPNTLRSCVGGSARILHSEVEAGDELPAEKLCLIELQAFPTIKVEGYLLETLDAVTVDDDTGDRTFPTAEMAVFLESLDDDDNEQWERIGQITLTNRSMDKTGVCGTQIEATWYGRTWRPTWVDFRVTESDNQAAADILDLEIRTDGT